MKVLFHQHQEARMSTLKIINGPSKEELALNLFHQEKMKRRFVLFSWIDENEDSRREGFIISSLKREDGSGESWDIRAQRMTTGESVGMHFYTNCRKGLLITGDDLVEQIIFDTPTERAVKILAREDGVSVTRILSDLVKIEDEDRHLAFYPGEGYKRVKCPRPNCVETTERKPGWRD